MSPHDPEDSRELIVGTAGAPGGSLAPSLKQIRSTPWFCGALAVVLALGVTLRLTYINQTTFNLDEQIAQAVVQNLEFPNQWDTNWAKSNVTEMFRYDQYNFSSYHYVLYVWNNLFSLLSSDWLNHVGVWRSLNGLFGLVFLVAVAFSLRKSVGEMAALAGVSAGAIIPLLIQDAHYLRCESMLTTGVAILLWLPTVRVSQSGWPVFVGGLVAGWMIASKATMVFALPVLLLLIPAKSSEQWKGKSIFRVGCLIGFGVILGIVVGMPGGVAQPHLYFAGLSKMAQHYSSPMPPYTSPDMAPSFRVTIAYMIGTLGWGFWIFTVIGIGGMARIGGWWRTAILCSPLATALTFFGSHPYFAERSFSPFLPIVAVFFGVGVQVTIETLRRFGTTLQNRRSILLAVMLSSTLAIPAVYSWKIIFNCFSGREQIEKDAALSRMKGNLSGRKIIIYSASQPEDYYQTIAETISHHEPMLVVLVDELDPISAEHLKTIQHTFGGRILGVRESLFPNLPSCTLHTFLSPRLWLIHIPAN